MNNLTLESEYLIKLIKNVINEEEISPAPEGMDWKSFIDLAKKQQVYSVIAEALEKLNIPKEQKQQLTLYSQNELLRMLAMKSEFEEIEQELNEKEIKYMLLKGSVLRRYYPKEKMRQMSDMDILYDFEKRDSLLKIMKKRGYRLTATCENSDDFFKEPFYTFEWHRELFFKEAKFSPRFDLWEKSVQDSEKPYKYHIDPTQHFVYTICHMFKHFITNGCGIRFLCDIYLLLKNDKDIDMESAKKQLEDIEIYDFAKNVIELSQSIFFGGEISDVQREILDFMLSNGVYGIFIIDYKEKLEEYSNSKFKYLFYRLFPPKKKMKAEYKILEKKPFLLPIYYFVRLFTKFRYNSSKAKNELKQIKNIDKNNGG